MSIKSAPLRFSAFVMNTTGHITQGTWRRHDAQQHRFNELDHWVELAKTLERGKFDFIFFADVIGLYGEYDGSHRIFAENGLQIPSNDPSSILSALAYATDTIGLAFTSALLQEHPFNFARRISTLDHASKGRIAWNIVTGHNANGYRNYGFDDLMPHDERYRWADEYVDIVYKLWEGSWDDDAFVQDKERGIVADPTKIHRIYHESERYKVEGPHLVAPSPQRTPLLFQAGSSPAGRNFAARNAEAQFLLTPNPQAAGSTIQDTESLLPHYGRQPGDLLFFQGLSFVVGSTEAEAKRKEAELDEDIEAAAMLAHLGGAIGVDFGGYDLDAPLDDIQTEGARSTLDWVRQSVTGRKATVRDLGLHNSKTTRIVGTPEQIADQLEAWRAAGIHGVNVINTTIPGTYIEFIDQVMPVLRERGLAQSEYAPGKTLRERIFGTSHLNERHPARKYHNAFTANSIAELAKTTAEV